MAHIHSRLIIIAVLGLFLCAWGQEWEWQNPLPQGNDLNDVVWMTPSTLISVGDFSTIMRSTDAGETWDVMGQNSTENYQGISRIDDQTAWVVGQYGTVLRTTDSGLTWQIRHDSSDIGILGMHAIHFVDANTGWVGGYDGSCDVLWHTADGGETWVEQELLGCTGVWGIDFVNASTGWTVGGYRIWHTTDSGANWTEQVWYDSTDEEHYYLSLDAVDFTDALNGWVVGDRVLHTTDGGQTWSGADSAGWGGVDVEFTTAQSGVLVSLNFIYLTQDGGEHWVEIDPEARVYLYGGLNAVSVRDASTLLLTGEGGEILKSEDGGVSWERFTAELVSGFHDVCFVDSLYGWAVGDNYNDANILHTINGGQTWTEQIMNPPVYLEGVFFRDRNKGWAVGDGGALCRTNDGGETWERTNVLGHYTSVHFVDSLNGWAVGWGQKIVHTSDGGLTWSLQREGPDIRLHDVYFADPENGWVVGCEAVIWHTADGGDNWEEQFHDEDMCLHQCSFVDAQTGWVAGGTNGWDGVILKTTDGGQSWIQDEREYPYFRGIEFFNHQIGWAVRPTYELYRTLDGGLTWTAFSTGTSNWISAICFGAVNRAWAVGENGTILHLADSITAVDDLPENLLPSTYSLKVYPNPFNSSTRLSYDVPVNGHVTLTVFDLTGRLVETLEDRVMPAGRHIHVFDGTGMASGVYFVRLEAGSVAQTQKLLLLK